MGFKGWEIAVILIVGSAPIVFAELSEPFWVCVVALIGLLPFILAAAWRWAHQPGKLLEKIRELRERMDEHSAFFEEIRREREVDKRLREHLAKQMNSRRSKETQSEEVE